MLRQYENGYSHNMLEALLIFLCNIAHNTWALFTQVLAYLEWNNTGVE